MTFLYSLTFTILHLLLKKFSLSLNSWNSLLDVLIKLFLFHFQKNYSSSELKTTMPTALRSPVYNRLLNSLF